MKIYVGKGAGKHIVEALKGAEKRVVVVSPWIGREQAGFLKELARKVRMKVVTSGVANPGLDAFAVRRMEPVRVVLGILLIICGVLVWKASPLVGLGLLFLALLSFLVSSREVLPRYVTVRNDVHAKAYVVDDKVFLASANLTPAGLFKNVEFVVELEGKEAEEVIREVEKL